MALVVKEDVTSDPMDVGLPGARRIVHETDGVVNLFEQLLGARFCGHFGRLTGDQESGRIALLATNAWLLSPTQSTFYHICFFA